LQNTLRIRYKLVHRLVNDLYISLGLTSYPLNKEKILSLIPANVIVISYDQFMHDFDLTLEQVFAYFTSEDGCCDYKPSKDSYIIYYNDININNKNRILWTIVHELAHIFCKHYTLNENFIYNYSSDEIYDFKEREANYFSSIFLAHPIILNNLNIRSSYEIEVFCNLSSQAAKYRYATFKKWTSYVVTSSDRYILRNFQSYIDSKNADFNQHLAFIRAFRY